MGSAEIASRARRLKVFYPADLAWGGQEARVHVLNVSRTGALLTATRAPAVGDTVSVWDGLFRAPARVIWRRGRLFGVAFARPFSDAELEELIDRQRSLIQRAFQRRQAAPVERVLLRA